MNTPCMLGTGEGNYTFFAMNAANISDIRYLSWIAAPYHLDVSSSLSVIQAGLWHAPIYIDGKGYGIASFNLTNGAYTGIWHTNQHCMPLYSTMLHHRMIVHNSNGIGSSCTIISGV